MLRASHFWQGSLHTTHILLHPQTWHHNRHWIDLMCHYLWNGSNLFLIFQVSSPVRELQGAGRSHGTTLFQYDGAEDLGRVGHRLRKWGYDVRASWPYTSSELCWRSKERPQSCVSQCCSDVLATGCLCSPTFQLVKITLKFKRYFKNYCNIFLLKLISLFYFN